MARRQLHIGVLIACVLISAGLWVYVTLSRVAEDDVDIPLTIKPPANQALLSAVPRTVKIRVRGSGMQILSVKYLNRSASCTVDLARFQASEGSSYRIDYDDLVRNTVLPSSMRIVSTAPSVLHLTTGDMVRATVPLELRYNISCRPGFELVGTPAYAPREVEVRGSRDFVERTHVWHTERLLLDDVYQPMEVTVPVSDSLMTVLNVVPSTITVAIDVQQTAEVTVRQVPVVLKPAAAGRRVVPERISVTLQGGASVIADVTSEAIEVSVSPTAKGAVQPSVIVPPGTRLLRVDPAFVRLVE